MRRGLKLGANQLGIFGRLVHGGLIRRIGAANALPLTGRSSPEAGMPGSSHSAVNIIRFWDKPMMGSACPADDIWHPWYRQIRPFARPGRVLRADGTCAPGRRADP